MTSVFQGTCFARKISDSFLHVNGLWEPAQEVSGTESRPPSLPRGDLKQASSIFSYRRLTFFLKVIMKDKWMNMGYEEEDLKPYVEPVQDWNDRKRIEILEGMGYSNSMVEEALKQQKFDDCYASYLLLGRRNTEVSFYF